MGVPASADGLDARIARIEAAAYTIPTDAPESDGTIAWDSTTIVVVHASGGNEIGVGYSYVHRAAAELINDTLAEVAVGRRVTDVGSATIAMKQACRNLGRPGLASCAISAVDIALWDLKGRLLALPITALIGTVRDEVLLYGSGGFTSYSTRQLAAQLGGWAEAGFAAVKMKVGRDPRADLGRVQAARRAIGEGPELFVDANGAYDCKRALHQAEGFTEQGVTWFEEPVSSDDVAGLRLLRSRMPPAIEIAAGEYGYDACDFLRLLRGGAVDVLQADATRCGGITGFLAAGALCDAWGLPLSAHTAPTVHAIGGCATSRLRHVEYFHDHARIEQMLFDGVLRPDRGVLRPDRSRPGLGVDFKSQDARRYAAA